MKQMDANHVRTDSLSEALRNAMQSAVDGWVLRLTGRIDQLEAQVETLQSGRWPAMMHRRDAAAYLGLSPWQIDQLVRQGLIRYERRPGIAARVYLREELDRFRTQNGAG